MVEYFDEIAKSNISYHLDEKLKRMWDKLKEGRLQKLNEDRVYLVDGRERTGKSSFAFQQAKYIDPTFTVENICFLPEQFLDRIRNAPPGAVVVFDEAFRGLSSKSTRSKVNKAIVQALMEVGQRNLVIFVVLPTLFLLEIYAAVFRSEALFHIYKNKGKTGKLRAFKIYNYKKKKELYLRGKTKYFSYSRPIIKRSKGRFYVHRTKEWPSGLPYTTFDMKTYLAKKGEAFGGEEQEEEEDNRSSRMLSLVLKAVNDEYFHSQDKLSDWLSQKGMPLNQSNISRRMAKLGNIKENN